MPAVENKQIEVAHPDLVTTRTFAAPRNLVFKSFIEPRHLAAWWGPRGFNNPVCELDARPEGKILIHMQGPDGMVYPMHGKFLEIEEPTRLVFSATAENPNGVVVIEDLTTILFEEFEGITRISLTAHITMSKAEAAPMLEGMEEGWSQSLDKLTEYLAKISKV